MSLENEIKHDSSEFQESLLLVLFLNPPCLLGLLLFHQAGSGGSLPLPRHDSLANYPSL